MGPDPRNSGDARDRCDSISSTHQDAQVRWDAGIEGGGAAAASQLDPGVALALDAWARSRLEQEWADGSR